MQYLTPYHLCTYLLLSFAAGHTIGGLFGTHDYGEPANNVFALMQSIHFDFFGSDCTFYGVHMGFGLIVTVFLLFSALLTWVLASANPAENQTLKPIKWALFFSYVVTAGLSWKYFFAGPGFFVTTIAGLMGWECLKH